MRAARSSKWLCGLLVYLAWPAYANDIPEVPFVAAQFQLDGELNESAWDRALKVDLTYETRPGENTRPTVNTQVRLIDTGSAFMVAFLADDPDPSQIRAHLRDRDDSWDDDFVGVVLDTFNDERRALEFFVNPYGAQMDLIMDDVNGNEDSSWDAIWDAAGKIHDQGFTVEMEIPYTALQLPGTDGEKTWGIDILRFYPRDERYRISNNAQDRSKSCYLCQLDKIRGFSNAEPGRDLEITPTLVGTAAQSRDELDDPLGSTEVDWDPGLDVNWGITPNWTLNGTLNPDFSQVEADVAQLDVNNTFALFFPEKRPFFLDGADFFDTPNRIVYTRNVTDPDYGVRVTGKQGRNVVGFFYAEDEVTNLLIPGALGSDVATIDSQSTDAAFRYRRDILDNSSVGFIATHRDGDDYNNLVAGVDGRLRFNDSHTVTFQYLTSDSEYPQQIVDDFEQAAELDGDQITLRYNYDSRNWFSYLRYDDSDEGFRPDLGFVNQVDIKRGVVGAGRIWHGTDDTWWSRLRLNGDWDRTEDQSGQLLEEEAEMYFSVQGPMQSFVEIGGGVRDRFWDGVLFDEKYFNIYGEFQPRGGVRLELFTRISEEVDFANTDIGDQLRISPRAFLSLGDHWSLNLRHTFRNLKRDGGTVFEANQTDFRVGYQFDLRQRLRLTLQYTDVDRDPSLYVDEVDERFTRLGTQLIYSYKVNPRTVLFAGYSDNGIEDDSVNSLTTTNKTLFFKLGYAWEPQF